MKQLVLLVAVDLCCIRFVGGGVLRPPKMRGALLIQLVGDAGVTFKAAGSGADDSVVGAFVVNQFRRCGLQYLAGAVQNHPDDFLPGRTDKHLEPTLGFAGALFDPVIGEVDQNGPVLGRPRGEMYGAVPAVPSVVQNPRVLRIDTRGSRLIRFAGIDLIVIENVFPKIALVVLSTVELESHEDMVDIRQLGESVIGDRHRGKPGPCPRADV